MQRRRNSELNRQAPLLHHEVAIRVARMLCVTTARDICSSSVNVVKYLGDECMVLVLITYFSFVCLSVECKIKS